MEWTRIAKLNNSNYESWAFSVKALLRREGLWKYVDPGTAPNPVTSAWTDGDEKTLSTLQLLVEESQIHLIRSAETAKATWSALKEHHSKLTLGQKVSTLKQITNLNFRNGDDMEGYFAAIEKLYVRLENAGFAMQECLKVALVLRGLPDSFTPLIMALEARNEADLTMAMVKAKLTDEADKRKDFCSETNEQALRVGARPKMLSCYHCGKAGHKKWECKEYLAERSSDDEKEYRKKSKEKARAVREPDQSEYTFMVKSGGSEAKSWPWVIDSGATSHLTNDRSVFVRLNSGVRPVMSTADGRTLRTEGTGDCELKCLDDRGQMVKITLTDVIYAPELEGSMVSIGKLSEKGVKAEFVGEKCKLRFNGRTIATATKSAGLYRLNLACGKSLTEGEAKVERKGLETGEIMVSRKVSKQVEDALRVSRDQIGAEAHEERDTEQRADGNLVQEEQQKEEESGSIEVLLQLAVLQKDQMQTNLLTRLLGPAKLKALRGLIGVKSSEVEEECWS